MIDEKVKIQNDLDRLYEIQDIINHLNLSSELTIHQTQDQPIIQNQIIVLEKEIIIWKEKLEQCEKEKKGLQELLQERDQQLSQLQEKNQKIESDLDQSQTMQQEEGRKKLQKGIKLCESQEDQEAQNYLQLFTTVFSSDPTLSGYFALNAQLPSELPKAINDGVILCKLLNFVKAGTIDERAINNKHPLDKEQKIQNINLAISGAKSIGSMLGSLNAQEILQGNQKEILNLIYQILKAGLLNTINLKDCPQLIAIKQQNETAQDLAKLKPEEMLKRWLGYVMSKSVRSKKKQVFPNNFSRDLSDGECLLGVTEALLKGKWREESNEQIEKLAHALESQPNILQFFNFVDAEELGINNWTMPEMIGTGNPKINEIFCAQLFHGFNGLSNASEEQLQAKIELDKEDDDQTVSREERTFRMWVNSLSLPNTGFIANLFDESSDGILLLKLIDSIKPNCVNWSRVEKNAQTHVIKQISNCNLAIETAKTELGLPLIGIGGKDIHDRNKKLVIALMHQLMLKDVTKTIGNLKEDELIRIFISFILEQLNGQMQKLEMLFRILKALSLYLLNLLHQINPKLIDWSMVYLNESQDSLKQNAQYVISIARKLGASLFLVWEDIVELKIKMIMTLFASLKEYDIQFNA